jgi:NADH-quinone oxidoreductase subunit N
VRSLVIILRGELRLSGKSSKRIQYEYYLLIMFSTLGAILITKSNNLLRFYLSLEIISLPLFGLVCTQKSLSRTEAGLKYFILGAFSRAFLLFGISIIFIETGSLEFAIFKMNSFDSLYSQLGITFLLVGFLFKMAAFPFHA